MTHHTMSSRTRLLAAIQCQPVDHLPCSFMLFKGLWGISGSYLDFILRQIELGLDAFVQIPTRQPGLVSDSYNLHGLPVSFHPDVRIAEWKEVQPGERWPILIKEYQTPAGTLRAEVRQDDEWPYREHVPFLDDFLETRSRKFIVESRDDLEALRFLLVPPNPEEIRGFRLNSEPVVDFARRQSLMVAGGWGVGADLIGWVYGLQNMIYAGFDQPDLLDELLTIIQTWNRSRMQVVLDFGVDLFIKRAWYENCDFWSPKSWRRYIFPGLKDEAEFAHAHGARFGYLITANCMPLLDMIEEAGVDVIIGADPERWDLQAAMENLSGKVCLWGGVNGHLTVEQGQLEDVRTEVRDAIRGQADRNGLILSPVDNIRELNPTSLKNVEALIQEWKKLTGQGD
jgi:uroporphyrinogen-III decarboxylase